MIGMNGPKGDYTMKETRRKSQIAVCCFCACLVVWMLGLNTLTSAPDPDQIEMMKVGGDGDPNDPNELDDPNDPNEPEEPTWAEMAENTYFMIFIDLSDSMRSNDIEAMNKAVEMFSEHLAENVYEGDKDRAVKHVILSEVINERYLQHMAAWNQDDPNATRYVNIFFTNEAEQDYYIEGSILYPTDKFKDDLEGNQEAGGFIYGLRNELSQRTFSIGKLYNMGGKQGKNVGGFHPVFAVHLYCAFNNVGEYCDTNLTDLALSYENIESNLTPEDYLQYIIDTLDYSAAYISEPQTDEDPEPKL